MVCKGLVMTTIGLRFDCSSTT